MPDFHLFTSFRKCDSFEQILTNVRLKLHGESVEDGNIDRALVAEKVCGFRVVLIPKWVSFDVCRMKGFCSA